MVRITRLVALLFPLVLLAGSAPAWAEDPTLDGWLVERHEWRRPAPELTRLTVRNPHGDLRIRPAAEDEIYFLGLIQRHADDPLQPDFIVREEGTELVLEVAYGNPGATSAPEAWGKRRVDVSVLVPSAVTLSVETDRGLVEVKKTSGDLTAKTRFGEIVTVTSGSVDAESVHGAIRSELRTFDWTTPPRFTTLTGDIRVQLPRTVAASVRLESQGELTTDFSLEIVRDLATGHKVARAEIGGGGTLVTITSTNGAIKLLQSITGY